jgi:FkbM family methyltransferase
MNRRRFSALVAMWRWLQAVDAADPVVLRPIPSAWKRAAVRQITRMAPIGAGTASYEVEGLAVLLPGSTHARAFAVASQAGVAKALRARLTPGMTFVDVGAKVGLHSLLGAALVGPTGRVIAVEPGHDNLIQLEENVRRNKLENVRILRCAAGAVGGDRMLYARASNPETHSLFPGHVNAGAMTTYAVAVHPLDVLVPGTADVVKIDVEGGELDVLAGMPRLIAENPRICLVVEWNPRVQEAAGFGPTELLQTLLTLGFQLEVVGASGLEVRTMEEIDGLLALATRFRDSTVDLIAVRQVKPHGAPVQEAA